MSRPGGVTVEDIGDGDPAVAVTLLTMRRLLDQARRDPSIRLFAEALVRDLASYDTAGILHRIYTFVHTHVRYRYDPVDVELLKSPRVLLTEILSFGVTAGDCDDQALLLSALAEALGYPARLVAVSQRANGELHHVYLEVQTDSGWVRLDPIVSGGTLTGIGGRMDVHRRVTA